MNFLKTKRYGHGCYFILFVFLAVLSLPSLHAQTVPSEKITLQANRQPVEQVFAEITRQTGLKFFYSETIVGQNYAVDLNVKDEPVARVLNEITRQVRLYFFIDGNTISVSKSQIADTTGNSDNRKRITGTITDDSGEPIIGANVIIKGTTTGTVTDLDGRYSIDVRSSDILQISYIGYIQQEIQVGNNTTLSIRLEEDSQSLDEIVVVGYGTQKRSNLSGAISRVSSATVESKPVTNVLQALQGEIPGMVVQRTSGAPGKEEFEMNVRGESSTNGGNSPLVLIDGMPGNINLLNPQDIESISVLKDASASIYGARAAGGVVLITTKKGQQGKPKVSYSGNLAITKMSGMMKSPTNYEMAIMDNEANINNGSAPMYTQDLLDRIIRNDPNPIDHPLYGGWKLFFTNTDWIDELLHNGVQHRHNFTITGGNNTSNYYLSAGYSKQYGVIKYADDNNQRYNLRLNYDYNIADWLRLETKVSLENQKRTEIGGTGNWVIQEAVFGMPNHPVYNADGNYFAQGGWGNAIALAKEGENGTYNTREMNGNFRLIADITKDLTLNAQVGLNFQTQNNEDIGKATPLYTWDNDISYYQIANRPQDSWATRESLEKLYQNYTAYLQYSKSFGGIHNLDVMAGLAYEKEETKIFNATRDNFITESLWALNLGGTGNMKNDGMEEHWAIGSGFSRIGYNFKNKYILETNLRYDGSSRFARNNRWRMFPGVSAGWRMAQENFLSDVEFLDELKLRASYGQTGNQDGIRLYDYIQLMDFRRDWWKNVIYYPFGDGSQTQSISLDVLAGVDRTWEILENTNVGIDAYFLSSRLRFSFDYFVKINSNMLIPVTYPSMLGAKAPNSNSGKLRTNGFEMVLGWSDKVNDLGYSVQFQLSDAKNKLVKYGGADTYELGLNEAREGYPVNSYFAYVFDGVIRTQEELDAYKQLEGVPSNIGIGDAKFKDLNNDGKISTYGDGDDGDAVFVGTTTPRFNFGLNLGLDYKNWDVSIFFQGVGKRTIFREGEYAIPWSDWWRQPPQFYYGKTWNPDRPDAYYPRLTHGEIRNWNYQASSLQKVNAAYIRLKNIQIGYSLPKLALEKIRLQKVRFYVSGQDLFEIHNVKGGWDPESGKNGFNYPFQRYYSFGVDVTF